MTDSNSSELQGRIVRYTDRAIYRDLKERARYMRQNPTEAEQILWQRLRHRRIKGYRFRRQHPIVRYIVDFYCAEAKLVIEVDGSIHSEPGHAEYDAERQKFLEHLGLRVLRFLNAEVMLKTDAVIAVIAAALN